MVLVRVRQDEDVDATIPGRQAFVECDEEASRVRPAVDDEPSTALALHEDAVALTDVEDRDVHQPV